MKYYINKNNEIFGFELDGSQDHLITKGMTPITLEEIELRNKPTPEQLLEQQKAEAQQYLNSTDWYIIRFIETGTLVPNEVSTKRAECKKILNP